MVCFPIILGYFISFYLISHLVGADDGATEILVKLWLSRDDDICK